MAVVPWKESTVTLPLLPSAIFPDGILLYSLFRGKRENLLQQSRVVLRGLAHCLETLCCEPPSRLQDSLGLGDTAGALALLVPSSLPPPGTPADTTPPTTTPSPPDQELLQNKIVPSLTCTEGPSLYVWFRTESEWGRSECACAVTVLGAAAQAHFLLMTTFLRSAKWKVGTGLCLL